MSWIADDICFCAAAKCRRAKTCWRKHRSRSDGAVTVADFSNEYPQCYWYDKRIRDPYYKQENIDRGQ